MRTDPKTEVTISEIMGALTLRVVWAAAKRAIFLIAVYLLCAGIWLFSKTYFGWNGDWLKSWQYQVPASIIIIWLVLRDATGHRSFHRQQWYFPKTNAFASLLMSAYIVLSVWALIYVEGWRWGLLGVVLYGGPAFIYYILNCGYYLVMMRRYPNYAGEDFAIEEPSVIFDLSVKEGGIDGIK